MQLSANKVTILEANAHIADKSTMHPKCLATNKKTKKLEENPPITLET